MATAFAIYALTMFDHLNFRNRMKDAEKPPAGATKDRLELQKPTAISGADQPWFAWFYVAGSQRERDRITFSRR